LKKVHFTSSIYILGVMLLYVCVTLSVGEIISYMHCDTGTSRARKE